MHARITLAAVALSALAAPARGQDPPGDIRELKLRDWEPKSMMVTKATTVERPKFPVIDVHNHLGGGKARLTPEVVRRYLEEMDAAGVRTVVDLDGGWGDRLKETLAALDEAHPGRFLTFALVDFDGIDDPGWSVREARRLDESFRVGAKGLKFHKSLGLSVRYKDGRLMPVDDPKLDPVWGVCAQHRKPVVIHTADPAAFFTPLDRFNERWHELNEHPNWLFFGEKFPRREELLDQLHRVIARHPNTTFINTHFGNNAEDLASVAEKLDKYPNMYVDIDARISELGRQPYTARRFFLKYQDRILFGTDTTPDRDAYRIYYRFLETDDEYFDASASHHRQGFWNIYGIFLPDPVLEKVYRGNAERIFGLAGDVSKAASRELRVRPTADFELTGDGSAREWEAAAWEPLHGSGRRGERRRDAGEGPLFAEGPLRAHGRGRRADHGDAARGLRRSVEGGCLRGLPADRRARPDLFRVRGLAAGPRAADRRAESRRRLPGLAPLALRGGPQGPQGDGGRRRQAGVRGCRKGVAGRSLHPLRPAQADAERPPRAGHAMARELLPDGLRRRQTRELGLVARRARLPRVRQVRDARL